MQLSALSVRARLTASLLAVTIVMVVFHVVVAMRSSIDQWALALLLLVAALVALSGRVMRSEFRTAPTLSLAFHVATYLLVAGSIAVHAMAADESISGVSGLLWMVACWGVGLLVHTLSVVGGSSRLRHQV